MPPKILVVADLPTLAQAGADLFSRAAREAIAGRATFRVALAGGSTPRGVYETLAAQTVPREASRPPDYATNESQPTRVLPWEGIHVFWGDERHVPPDHPDSNYRMAYEALLSRVPIPAHNVHRIRGEEPDPQRAAALYEADLIESFGIEAGDLPRFDLILLGMGPDGHTASLFPGSPALESPDLVAAPWVEHLSAYRVTLTPRVINHAARVVFLVAGADKAETLRAVLEGDFEPRRLPAQIARPTDGECLWLVDAAAARLLRDHGKHSHDA